MKIQQFLEHHGIARNPFAEEDAQTDPVFKDHCIASTYHPAWDKVYGDPGEPSTSIVFGEKGSGKTAMRLQIARHLAEFNRQNPRRRLFVIHYDDFNPFLDRFRDRLSSRRQRPDRALGEWKLWDHMDAILSLGVTGLVDRILDVKQPSHSVECTIEKADIKALDRHQVRDLLLLAACYDQSTSETFRGRWDRLRKLLGFSTWKNQWDFALGWSWMAIVGASVGALLAQGHGDWVSPLWVWLLVGLAGWAPWLWRGWKAWWRARGVLKRLRIGSRETGPLRRVFMQFSPAELSSQPLPNKESTDDRYELLQKLQSLLESLGHPGVVVLVDRVDEPHLVNGAAEQMRALIWPMLDNKFLKQPGLGVKLMLPLELTRFIEREDREFYQRARLDKQNMISSFEWTGEALYDVANARLRACASEGAKPSIRLMFQDGVSDRRLVEAMRSLRTPRHLHKFLYRLLVAHCNAHTDEAPEWQIPADRFEATLALYNREQDAFDRGMGAG